MPTTLGIVASHRTAMAGGWTPASLTGLAAWYDADDASTFTYSSSTVVSQWRDKSPDNRHLGQATVSMQPNRNGTQNGKTTVTFDGSDDYMDTASFTLPQPFTIGSAGNFTSKATFGFVSSIGGNLQTYSGAGTRLDLFCGTNLATPSLPAYAYATPMTVTFTAASSTGFIYRDNVQKHTGAVGANGTTTGLRIASDRNLTGTYRLQGSLFEIIVYNRVLNSTERDQVESYLKTKWGI